MCTAIDSAGRIVVPKHMRDELGLRGGQKLEITACDGHIEVDVPPVPMHLDRAGLLDLPADRCTCTAAGPVIVSR